MSGIFVSYRRDDSAGHAGRLGDALKQRFGSDLVFMDVDAIEPGLDFVEAIEKAVEGCDALLVVIGKQWLAVDEKGRRRLDDPQDYVRLEISNALKRNIRVIPVLVEKTAMPAADALPEDVAPLTRRNAFELANTRWQDDIKRLIEVLEKVVKGSITSLPESQHPSPAPKHRSHYALPFLFVPFGWLAFVTWDKATQYPLRVFFIAACVLSFVAWFIWLFPKVRRRRFPLSWIWPTLALLAFIVGFTTKSRYTEGAGALLFGVGLFLGIIWVACWVAYFFLRRKPEKNTAAKS